MTSMIGSLAVSLAIVALSAWAIPRYGMKRYVLAVALFLLISNAFIFGVVLR